VARFRRRRRHRSREGDTIAIFGAGIVLGLLATAQRRAFASRWIWLGGLAAC
jgi:hypothetical protein